MNTKQNKKRNLYIIVAILAATTIIFRLLNDFKLEQTSLLFVGVPTLLTLLLIKYVDKPKSVYGLAFYTTTLFLLMCSILLGEGLICIIMMAPLFYGVMALIVFVFSWIRAKNKNKMYSFILIPLLLMVSEANNINRNPEVQIIKTTITVNQNQELSKLNIHPDFLENFPTFFKIGFPKPIAIFGNGIQIGDARKINFKSSTKGIGTLHLKVKEKTKNSITYNITEDTTHMHHWLTLNEVIVTIENKDNNTAKITWTTQFTCSLGPSWYFKSIEKYAINIMNTHLINAYFN